MDATPRSLGASLDIWQFGQCGPVVAEVRNRLHRLGFLEDIGDDQFDGFLDRAVRQFQQERGIKVDGIVGPITYRRLEEARWRLGDRVLQFLPGHLMVGDDVLALQERLTGLGFSPGRTDGVFGIGTDHAVREFQLNTGLPTDGTSGAETFRALGRLTRTISGGASALLREQQAFDILRTGLTHKSVVLDVGPDSPSTIHQGHGLTEGEVASDVAIRVEERLLALGSTVLVTGSLRANQAPIVDGAGRASIANEIAADVVISLRCDAHSNPEASGVVAFYYGTRGPSHSVAGRSLANLLLDEIGARTNSINCGAHPKTWDLLRLTQMPVVHLDLGYLTNDVDATRLGSAEGRDHIARAVTAALIRFFAPPVE